MGSGTLSPRVLISATTSRTSFSMPCKASSLVDASHESDGNSVQSPTYSLSSSDQVTRYVYLSVVLLIFFSIFVLAGRSPTFLLLPSRPRGRVMAQVRHRRLCRRGFQLAQVSLYRLEQLTDLIGFRFSFVVLHVHARIAGPRHLPNAVAGSVPRRRAKEIVGDLAGVGEPYACGVLLHFGKEFVDACGHNSWCHYWHHLASRPAQLCVISARCSVLGTTRRTRPRTRASSASCAVGLLALPQLGVQCSWYRAHHA